MTTHSKLSLTSEDPNAQRNEALKFLFPDAFREGKIDFDSLKASLGGIIEDNKERYGLTWAGKAEAIRAIQGASVGTLLPDRDASVDFETTGNLIIEGDNLEVLKLLQKSYHGKVKMIYIDPPYNTGNEFIYPDNFREGLQDYLRYSGQVMDDGTAASSNRDTGGRIHSKWLSMMYPRLFLAKNLLREDGVIFVSIDDHEVANLRLMMDEIFGEENFLTSIHWRRTESQDNQSSTIAVVAEHIVCYGKKPSAQHKFNQLSLSDRALREYRYQDEKGLYRRGTLVDKSRGKHFFDLETPSGEIIEGPFNLSRAKFDQLPKHLIHWASGKTPYKKIYAHDVEGQTVSNWFDKEFGTNEDGADSMKLLFSSQRQDDRNLFDFPKPANMISTLVHLVTNSRQMSGGGGGG